MSDNPFSTGADAGYGSATVNAGFSTTEKPAEAPAPANAPGELAAVIKDVTTQSFMTDVIEASKTRPVLVDFWAEWCGPCKQLGPIIEKAVTETNGAVTLAKMDIDKNPEVAGQMGIQSIPAVVAFVDGKPADAFMGAKPESEVKAFIERIAGPLEDPVDENITAALEQARELEQQKDHAGAVEIYAAILAQEPGNLDALAGLGACYVAVGELERARQMLGQIPKEHRGEDPITGFATQLTLAEQAADLGDIGQLAAAVEVEPDNHQARFDYALALNGKNKREEAAEQLLAIVRKNRGWEDEKARKQLVEFFDAWGNTDPATLSGRRGLSSILFS